MSYAVQSDLTGLIPPEWVAEALDDNADGGADTGLFTEILTRAEKDINGILSTSYAVPIASPESYPFLNTVATYEIARLFYARRGYQGKEGFPHYDAWKSAWDKLNRIGAGKEPLGPGAGSNDLLAKPRGSIITGPAKTYSSGGLSAC
jgi:hypothetical protein